MADQLRYDGKVAIVTGAGNGLGRAHALLLGARGAKVVVNDLGGSRHGEGQSTSAADKVVEEIKAAGGDAVANYDSVENGEAIVKSAVDAFGTVDIVINNAGILRDVSFGKMTDDDWNIVLRVHLFGSYSVSHAAWPILREKGYGRIVMTTSASGIYGNFGQANYSAAKLGICGLANTLAIEGKSKGVLVNTIAPIAGSRLTETVMPPELVDALKPEYVSPLVAYLCHDSCAETGGLFEIGAGYIGKLRWERTEGQMFRIARGFTPEDVAAKWSVITDFSNATHPANGQESFEPILANVNSTSLGGNEFLDLDTAAASEVVVETSYDERDLALYALGIGAARDATDPNELRYVYELDPEKFVAQPTYAVMPPMNAMLAAAKEGRNMLPGMNYGFERLLHGEQFTEIKRPLPPSAKLKHTFKFKSAWDKKPHAVVTWAITTTDESGEELAYNEISTFVKGAGGWGGERGPSGDINTPPDREPDAIVEEKTDPNQALLYRLSGDWNPLHIDPAFARMFGLEKPILHGLCTFGYVGRAVIKAMAGNDPRLFKSIKVRFADSVFPGETLVTRIWKESDTRFIVETRVKERDSVVVRNAAVELYADVPQPKPKTAAKPEAAKPDMAAIATEAGEENPSGGEAPAEPIAADIFSAISKYIANDPNLAGQIKTVFQLNLTDPASSYTIDLKNGAGSCKPGTATADVTLEITDANFMAMCAGTVDANKLYFGGQLKISGNVMASQKLTFLQKMDRKLVEEAMAARGATGSPAATPSATPEPTAPATSKPAKSVEIFEGVRKRLASNGASLNGLAGKTVQFNVSDPDAKWTVASGTVTQGESPNADTVIAISDDDLALLASGKESPESLYQHGRLRVDGDVSPAHELATLFERS